MLDYKKMSAPELKLAARLALMMAERASPACGPSCAFILALEISRLSDVVARVERIGGGPGYRLGDETLVKLGEIRAALKGGE